MNDKVSIITPAYNSEKYIKTAIKSVLLQTYDNWELIVVDDCSTDNTYEVVKDFASKDSRIKLIKADKNGGAGYARNIAMDAANGKYYAFLDADDLWVPQRLEKQMKFMQENDYAITHSSFIYINADGEAKKGFCRASKELGYRDFLKDTQVSMNSVILDVSKTGRPYMPKEKGPREDMEMHLSLLKKGFTYYGLDEVLSFYRVTESQSSSDKVAMAKIMLKRYMQEKELSVVDRLYSFGSYAFNATAKRIRNSEDVNYDDSILVKMRNTKEK